MSSYDSALNGLEDPYPGQRCILFGGITTGATYLNDTWIIEEFGAKSDTFTQLTPTASPPIRAFHAYTSNAQGLLTATDYYETCVIFGGYDGVSYLNDMWKHVYEEDGTNTWLQETLFTRYDHQQVGAIRPCAMTTGPKYQANLCIYSGGLTGLYIIMNCIYMCIKPNCGLSLQLPELFQA